MKVVKWVDVGEVEVKIDLSAEDIAEAISEDPKRADTAKRGINNAYCFLKAIPDEVIAEMTPQIRATIFQAMTVQVERFKPADEVKP